MEQARTTWTDERLDDMSRRMDLGFERVDAELRALRSDLSRSIDNLQRLMIQMMGGTLAVTLGTLVSVLLTRG